MKYRTTVIATVLVTLVVGMMGCGDSFLTRPPEGELTADDFYKSEQDLRMATGALYNQVWFDWNDKASFVIGDARAGNMWSTDPGYQQFAEFSVTRENSRLNEAWRSLYIVVNQSNLVIENIRNRTSGIDEEARMQALAEARFIRGYAYSYLGQLWGAVPIVTNTAGLIDQPDRRRNRQEDVFQFAVNDFQFAAEHLPTEADQPGRLTEWSAKGMLARMYWTLWAYTQGGGGQDLASPQAYLDSSRTYARDVIDNSGMSLRENYGDLFLLEEEDTNNEQEALFALQWTYEGNQWGTQNTIQSYFAPSSDLTGFADGWGGGTGVQAFMIEEFNAPDGGDERRPEIFMMSGDYYPELMQEQGGYTYEAAGADSYTGNATSLKKYVIGRPSDNDGRVAQQRTGIDTYMLRLAEVYLTYAQTFVQEGGGSTSNSEALKYYNRVRERAGLQPVSGSITFEDVFMEKWKELAFEGQCWFMLVRWHMFEPEAAKQFIRDQGRNRSVSYDEDGNVTIGNDPSTLEVTDELFTLQYPEQDVLQNNLLLEPPVAYDFSNQGAGSE